MGTDSAIARIITLDDSDWAMIEGALQALAGNARAGCHVPHTDPTSIKRARAAADHADVVRERLRTQRGKAES